MKQNIIKFIPNIFTFINLSLGFSAIVVAINGDVQLGCFLVLLSGIMDRFDGKMARKLQAESELGKELDSLSDLVSFGVAPAVLIWESTLNHLNTLGLLLVIFFVMAGAYRLARFNVSEHTNEFMGIPITIAGCLLVLDNLFSFRYGPHLYLTSIYVIVLSLLMISTIKIKKM